MRATDIYVNNSTLESLVEMDVKVMLKNKATGETMEKKIWLIILPQVLVKQAELVVSEEEAAMTEAGTNLWGSTDTRNGGDGGKGGNSGTGSPRGNPGLDGYCGEAAEPGGKITTGQNFDTGVDGKPGAPGDI